MPGRGKDLGERLPRAHRAITDDQLRIAHAATAAVATRRQAPSPGRWALHGAAGPVRAELRDERRPILQLLGAQAQSRDAIGGTWPGICQSVNCPANTSAYRPLTCAPGSMFQPAPANEAHGLLRRSEVMAGTPADKDQPNHPTESEPPAQGQKYLRSGCSQFSRQDSTDYSKLWPTVRMRSTLLYGGMFLIAGSSLISIIYNQVARGLKNSSEAVIISDAHDLGLYSEVCPYIGQARDFGELNAIVRACLNEQHAAALDSLQQKSLLFLLILTVLAFAIGYVLAGRVLHPLGRITKMMRSIASSQLDKRLDLRGPEDELKELAETFDDMMDRLDQAFNAQQRFVSNASHELRTPLAINRTLLEVNMPDPNTSTDLAFLGKSLLATNRRSEQLVEGLLLLARSENELVERKSVDIAVIASQAVQQVSAEAESLGVKLRGEYLSTQVQGNSVMLERLASNLAQNAIHYNLPTGGWVEVKVAPLANCVTLTVINPGPVIPAYEVDNLFEPFTHLRDAHTGNRRGVGFGLAIVRSVARSHGGAVTARPRASGGLEVEVRLPAQQF